jgi:hypothetical protein
VLDFEFGDTPDVVGWILNFLVYTGSCVLDFSFIHKNFIDFYVHIFLSSLTLFILQAH